MRTMIVRRYCRRSVGLGLFCVATIVAHAQATTPAAPQGTTPAPGASPSIFDEDPATLTPPRIPDKLEGFNRAIFKFNDGFYDVTLRPIAKGYAAVVPAPVRRGIGRFFHNIAFPTRFAGNLLEGKVRDAGTEFERFLLNTVSSLGFLATADKFPDLKEKPSDLGHAFGSWGIGHGTYLILPVLGPSSIRDGVGMGISRYALDPTDLLPEWEYQTGATATSIINESPEQMNAYAQLKAASVDPYVALRDAYSARRTRRVVNEAQVSVVPTATATPPAR